MPSARAARMLSVADAQRRARRILPPVLFDYIDGGSDDEVTLAENERAFRDLGFRPRMGVGIDEPSIATTVLGTPLALPVLLAPVGMVQLVHPDGAVGVARAASAAGTISVLSKIALCSPAEVARAAAGPHWFQVNSVGGREQVKRLLDRASEAGFGGLVATIDGPPPGNHGRDRRHGVVPPVRMSPGFTSRMAAQILARPQWAGAMVGAAGRQRATIREAAQVLASPGIAKTSRFTWSDIDWLRSQWSGSLLVKGVLSAPDAVAARDAGADAVVVSNHGGRSLDGVPATIRVLPEVAAAVGDSTQVLLDGGVRQATDVIKALCLGARAVLIGRPFVYGLAYAGQPGVARILELFHTELVRTMRLLGCPALTDLGTDWIEQATEKAGV